MRRRTSWYADEERRGDALAIRSQATGAAMEDTP
jgi:hypothetical protein